MAALNRACVFWARAVALSAVVIVANAAEEKPVFKHALDGLPVDVPLKPGEEETPALRQFKSDGSNLYRGDSAAISAGRALYNQHCQVCHNADGSGRMGPPLIGGNFIYPQTENDVGMFAIIYAGASGAMQPFSRRELSQDDMLKVIAYVRSLDKP